MNVYAAQEMDVEEVAEEVAAVAVPRTDPPPANPASALPIIIKRGRNQIPYIYNLKKKNNAEQKTYLFIFASHFFTTPTSIIIGMLIFTLARRQHDRSLMLAR